MIKVTKWYIWMGVKKISAYPEPCQVWVRMLWNTGNLPGEVKKYRFQISFKIS